VEALSAGVQEHGLLLVFLNVLIQQLGVPVPVLPTMMIAGALSVTGALSLPAALGAAILASLLADAAWYVAGIRFGPPILAGLCRVSLSPDSCVRQSEDRIGRWGAWALVIGKFVPGLSLMAPPLAGIVGLRPAVFVAASAAAAALYFGLGLALGRVFHGEISEALDFAERQGTVAAVALAALLAAYVGYRWLRRWAFLRRLRVARITVDELRQRIERGVPPVILDIRSAVAREHRSGIPGALSLDGDAIEPAGLNLAPGQEIVLYCNCPNEASAALVAKRLIDAGFTNVRPLKGGLEAWIAAGLPAGVPGGAGDRGAAHSGQR
jgi:membrane protein DedA with SNARE-associated domain/rhodanese-related sulfurtransferase